MVDFIWQVSSRGTDDVHVARELPLLQNDTWEQTASVRRNIPRRHLRLSGHPPVMKPETEDP